MSKKKPNIYVICQSSQIKRNRVAKYKSGNDKVGKDLLILKGSQGLFTSFCPITALLTSQDTYLSALAQLAGPKISNMNGRCLPDAAECAAQNDGPGAGPLWP